MEENWVNFKYGASVFNQQETWNNWYFDVNFMLGKKWNKIDIMIFPLPSFLPSFVAIYLGYSVHVNVKKETFVLKLRYNELHTFTNTISHTNWRSDKNDLQVIIFFLLIHRYNSGTKSRIAQWTSHFFFNFKLKCDQKFRDTSHDGLKVEEIIEPYITVVLLLRLSHFKISLLDLISILLENIYKSSWTSLSSVLSQLFL